MARVCKNAAISEVNGSFGPSSKVSATTFSVVAPR
jgi:hypothetical protein